VRLIAAQIDAGVRSAHGRLSERSECLNISDRTGEPTPTVAKHRDAATRDITVAFQGHYSRFVDMAH